MQHRRRAEQALVSVVATSYLLGVSTRRVGKLVEQLGVASLSKSQVSEMATYLDAQVEAFRNRPLDAGPYTLGASFAGDTAYASASAGAPFTITQEETQVTYSGATTSDYHDAFDASATLVDPEGGAPIEGKTITFTLGAGDICKATTDSSGHAECSITPSNVACKPTISPGNTKSRICRLPLAPRRKR